MVSSSAHHHHHAKHHHSSNFSDVSVPPHHHADSLLNSILVAFSMIIVSEIGDRTFFVACLMAMRHSRAAVFAGVLASMAFMTVLSVMMGFLLPSLISPFYSQIIAATLFYGFGGKLLYEGITHLRASSGAKESWEEEIAEVAAELERTDSSTATSPVVADAQPLLPHKNPRAGSNPLRAGKGCVPQPPTPAVVVSTPAQQRDDAASNCMSFPRRCGERILGPVFLNAFTISFFAEWGDRSQIATIALATTNPIGVTIGAILGHAVCTACAVIAGNLIASKVSATTVQLAGGCSFLLFAVLMTLNLLHFDA